MSVPRRMRRSTTGPGADPRRCRDAGGLRRPARAWHQDRWLRRCLRHLGRGDRGSAVAEFPLVAALVIVIALLVVQAAVVLHTRNTLTDAAVQGARHASLVGASPEDGASRTEALIADRLGPGFAAETRVEQAADGTITVAVTATLPLVGLIGPTAGLEVQGRAVDEDSW